MSKVSVLLPVYNNKNDILTSIQSVLDQTYTSWELIIIDDCSTDGTDEVLRTFMSNLDAKYTVTLITNEKNSGVYISLNKALLVATGDYICRIDSDDKVIKNYLELNVDMLTKNPQFIATRSYVQRYNTKVQSGSKIGEITLFYKKSIIDEIGYYDSVRFGADSEFAERVDKKYGKNIIGVIDKVTYYAQRRENSLTTSVTSPSGNWDIRLNYVTRYRVWHNSAKKLFMPFPLTQRPFAIDQRMV